MGAHVSKSILLLRAGLEEFYINSDRLFDNLDHIYLCPRLPC